MRGGGGIRAGVPQQTPAAALGLSRGELERQRLCVCVRERERAHVFVNDAGRGRYSRGRATADTRRCARPVPQRT